MKDLIILLLFSFLIDYSYCSAGDQSPYYQRCLERCHILNCTEDTLGFKNDQRSIILHLTQWTCDDDCKYDCMWKTVEAFHDRKWRTPQFHGKWPFVRILGMQEPASVLFSLLNGCIHIKMLHKFRVEVRPDSPLTWLWHAFSVVSVHAWFWSAVFHFRDFLLTEILDYACAFSMILMNCYVMAVRLLHDKVPRFALVTITIFFIAFLVSHVGYLSSGLIDYGYNMELNIIIGTFTAICWFGWCFYNRLHQQYVWKCAVYVAMTGIVIILEIVDRPPFFNIIDYHSLWHLSTAPLVFFIYSFAIDDSKYLREKELERAEIKSKVP
ncbi:hypothetical protein JTB14_020487 [Gonioctena quinquepunctata]|nr:hypothetical protein JTB14_020487 [Gonioctena quinquepunctata]